MSGTISASGSSGSTVEDVVVSVRASVPAHDYNVEVTATTDRITVRESGSNWESTHSVRRTQSNADAVRSVLMQVLSHF